MLVSQRVTVVGRNDDGHAVVGDARHRRFSRGSTAAIFASRSPERCIHRSAACKSSAGEK